MTLILFRSGILLALMLLMSAMPASLCYAEEQVPEAMRVAVDHFQQERDLERGWGLPVSRGVSAALMQAGRAGGALAEMEALHQLDLSRNAIPEMKPYSLNFEQFKYEITIPFFAYLKMQEGYTEASPWDKLAVLDQLHQKDQVPRAGEQLIRYLAYAYMAEKTAKLPRGKRGLAKLQAIMEIKQAYFEKDTTARGHFHDHIRWALVEHLAHRPLWARATPEQKLAYLAELKDQGLITDVEVMIFGLPEIAAPLAHDAAFMAMSPEERHQELRKRDRAKQLPKFVVFELRDIFAKPRPEDAIYDLPAALKGNRGYQKSAPIKKLGLLQEWIEAKRVTSEQVWRERVTIVFQAMQQGSSSKPLAATVELKRAAELLKQGREAKVPVWSIFDATGNWFLGAAPVVAAVWTQPAYQKTKDPLQRIQMLKQASDLAEGGVHRQFLWQTEEVMFSEVLAEVYLRAKPDEREQKVLAGISSLSDPHWARRFTERMYNVWLNRLLIANPDYDTLSPLERARFLNQLRKNKQLDDWVYGQRSQALWEQALKAEPKFMDADAAGKTLYVDQLKEKNLITHNVASHLKRVFELN